MVCNEEFSTITTHQICENKIEGGNNEIDVQAVPWIVMCWINRVFCEKLLNIGALEFRQELTNLYLKFYNIGGLHCKLYFCINKKTAPGFWKWFSQCLVFYMEVEKWSPHPCRIKPLCIPLRENILLCSSEQLEVSSLSFEDLIQDSIETFWHAYT